MLFHYFKGCVSACLVYGALAGILLADEAKNTDAGGVRKASGTEAFRPQLLLRLPSDCNMPDGMRLDPITGDVILACSNFKEPKYPGKLMKITPDNLLEPYFDRLPVHPRTGKVCPMGLDFGPDSNLYVADNQCFYDADHQSRLIRVNVRDGKPVGADVVVEGFILSNAVMWKDDAVYVTETRFDLPDKPGASGVYRFTLDELRKGKVTLNRKGQPDKHLVAEFITKPNHRDDLAGADGLTFDRDGNMFVGHFGDGQLHKITLRSDGSAKHVETLAGPPKLTCVDGIFCDTSTNKIYVADSEKNAIQVVSADDGSVETLWENEDTDGADGLLDQPCEVLLRGNKLIISNFDWTFPGLKNRKSDSVHTMSIIRLGGKKAVTAISG